MSAPVLFGLGQLVATPGALEVLEANRQSTFELARRHSTGDFGDISTDDAEANRRDIAEGQGRVLSAYVLRDGSLVWLMTNIVDGKATDTCALLPEEY